jgi:predicted nucleotidyltransferase
MKFFTVSVSLVGSHAYKLNGHKSDLDYVLLYKRGVKDYLTLGNYVDTMPEKTLEETSSVVNYKYWDVKKFLQMSSKSSWGAFEVLLTPGDSANPFDTLLRQSVRPEDFQLKPMLYHCLGVMKSSHHRGYMKAFHYLCAEVMLQTEKPLTTLSVWTLLTQCDLATTVRLHLTYLFNQKVKGVKDAPFMLEMDDSCFKDMVVEKMPDYTPVFHKLLEL